MRDKIKTKKRLQILLRDMHARGGRSVFTNGCFDLLHIGHVRYLEKARTFGDALIVGLNSDKSVRFIKDPRRPITPQRERAEILAALGCVDYVVLFDEPDPKSLITALLPDVLVKGGDWPKDQIIGNDIVQARGGKVITLPVVPHISTTNIINSIIKKYGNN